MCMVRLQHASMPTHNKNPLLKILHPPLPSDWPIENLCWHAQAIRLCKYKATLVTINCSHDLFSPFCLGMCKWTYSARNFAPVKASPLALAVACPSSPVSLTAPPWFFEEIMSVVNFPCSVQETQLNIPIGSWILLKRGKMQRAYFQKTPYPTIFTLSTCARDKVISLSVCCRCWHKNC